jgi:hypothetical protein
MSKLDYYIHDEANALPDSDRRRSGGVRRCQSGTAVEDREIRF